MSGDPVDPGDLSFTSHGICPDCTSNFRVQDGVSLREYIESMPFPVALFNSDLRLTFANSQASALFGRSFEELDGDVLGDVFECANARLPEGCGRTIHCSGCTIRRTLKHVHESGESKWMVPATLSQRKSTAALEISAVNSRGIVFLRIDRFGKPD